MQIILRFFLSDLSDDIRIELENQKKAVTEMEKEFELVAHPQIHAFRALLVRLFSRAPHTHREMEIGLVLDGNPQLTVNGTIRNLQSGDIYLLNPMELHEIHGQSGGALILAIQMSRQLVTSYFQHDENTCFIENSVRSFFSQHETRYDIMKGLLIELAYNYFGQFANYEYKCMSEHDPICASHLCSQENIHRCRDHHSQAQTGAHEPYHGSYRKKFQTETIAEGYCCP